LVTGTVVKNRGRLQDLVPREFGQVSDGEEEEEEDDSVFGQETVYDTDEDELGQWDDRSGLDNQDEDEEEPPPPPPKRWTFEDQLDLEAFLKLEGRRKDDEGDETLDDDVPLRAPRRSVSKGRGEVGDVPRLGAGDSEDELLAQTSDAEEATRIEFIPSDGEGGEVSIALLPKESLAKSTESRQTTESPACREGACSGTKAVLNNRNVDHRQIPTRSLVLRSHPTGHPIRHLELNNCSLPHPISLRSLEPLPSPSLGPYPSALRLSSKNASSLLLRNHQSRKRQTSETKRTNSLTRSLRQGLIPLSITKTPCDRVTASLFGSVKAAQQLEGNARNLPSGAKAEHRSCTVRSNRLCQATTRIASSRITGSSVEHFGPASGRRMTDALQDPVNDVAGLEEYEPIDPSSAKAGRAGTCVRTIQMTQTWICLGYPRHRERHLSYRRRCYLMWTRPSLIPIDTF